MRFKGWKIFALVIFASIVTVGLFLFLERPPSAAGIKPEEVLIKGRDAFRELDVVGRQMVTIYRNGKQVSSEEYPSPIGPWFRAKAMENGIGQAAGKMIAYEFLSKIAKKLNFDEDFFAKHQVSIIGPKKIAGRWAWEIEIKPNTPGNGFLRISFDKENGYPLERIKFDRNGEKENAIRLTEIKSFENRGHLRPDHPMHMPEGNRPGHERRFKRLFENLEGPSPHGPGPAFNRQRFMPPDEFHSFLNEGKALYPTHVPEGHHFMGARLLPPGHFGGKKKLQLIFSDGINVLSIFQSPLPQQSLHGADSESYLKSKVGELQNSFPEGFALRRVEESLLVAVGDIAPEALNEVLMSMTQFKGDKPVWGEDMPLNPDELY